MIVPQFSIESNSNRLTVQLDALPDLIRRRLKAKITTLTHELLSMVEAREPVRTGRLREATHAYVDDNPARNLVRGRVRILRTGRASRLGAAFGALEYGSTGRRFPVRAHARHGHPVRTYDRTGGIRARRFLLGSAAIMLPRARIELEQVIRQAAADALKS